jgi:hypothetical protein
MCKATTQRVKGVGMRWDGDNAEAILCLEALEQSGAWQSYREMQLRQAASALPPVLPRPWRAPRGCCI